MSKIGFCGPRSKWESMRFSELAELMELKGNQLVFVDMNQPIAKQGPFSVIIHKIVSLLNSTAPSAELDNFLKYTKEHPETLILDELSAVKLTLDRTALNQTLQSIQWPKELCVCIPQFARLESSDSMDAVLQVSAHLKFPVLAKPNDQDSTTHRFRLATKPEQLVGCFAPCILQEFIRHSGVVYKAYVLGDKVWVDARGSLRNVEDTESVSMDFHSQKNTEDNNLWITGEDGFHGEFPMKDFEAMAATISKAFGLHIFGYDVIIDEKGHYGIVDVNYFPGYKSLENFPEELCNLLANISCAN